MTKLKLFPVFVEVILEVLTGLIGLVILENMFGSWNDVKMSIIGEIITTSGFYGSQFRGPKRFNWTGYIEKIV